MGIKSSEYTAQKMSSVDSKGILLGVRMIDSTTFKERRNASRV
jgi:hypothetical protein